MEVLRAVEEVTGKSVPYQIAPRRDGDPASLVADSTKLRNALGWEPRRSSLQQIIKDSWEFHLLNLRSATVK
jgi:UDP-glucose 4-epimerase